MSRARPSTHEPMLHCLAHAWRSTTGRYYSEVVAYLLYLGVMRGEQVQVLFIANSRAASPDKIEAYQHSVAQDHQRVNSTYSFQSYRHRCPVTRSIVASTSILGWRVARIESELFNPSMSAGFNVRIEPSFKLGSSESIAC